MSDPYVYSESDVLINKLNIKNEKEWTQTELAFSFARIGQLKENPIEGKFDYKHLRKIHEYVFQDMYDWAGQDRNCDISKHDLYCKAIYLSDNAKDLFKKLEKENHLKNYDIDMFKQRATEYMAWIYHLHPFREGNTRSLCEFMRELTLNAGYELDLGKVDYKELRASLFASVHELNDQKLAIVLDKCVIETTQNIEIPDVISQAPAIEELSKKPNTKDLYAAYAKVAIKENGGTWSNDLDQRITEKMFIDGFEKYQVRMALKNSPNQDIKTTKIVEAALKNSQVKEILKDRDRGR